jgi:hypothetical protein
MGIVRERQIDKAISEVDALVTLLTAVNVSLAALEERVKALEDDHRQRSAASGNRGRPRKQLRDG